MPCSHPIQLDRGAQKYKLQGTMPKHLEALGFKTTPVIVTKAENLKQAWIPKYSPGGEGYKELESMAHVQTDISLYVTDKDEVLRDLSKTPGKTPWTQRLLHGKSTGDRLAKSGTAFTAHWFGLPDAESIYTDEQMNPMRNPEMQRAVREMQRYFPRSHAERISR